MSEADDLRQQLIQAQTELTVLDRQASAAWQKWQRLNADRTWKACDVRELQDRLAAITRQERNPDEQPGAGQG